jgi:hypothetical protein
VTRDAGPRPRGLCRECGAERALRGDGTIGSHNRLTKQGYGIGYCKGVGQPPATIEPDMAPPPPITVYCSIGNSDDKLSQTAWSDFARKFVILMRRYASPVFGVWFSTSDSAYQNACVSAQIPVLHIDPLRLELAELREEFSQDSIAWAAVCETEFL